LNGAVIPPDERAQPVHLLTTLQNATPAFPSLPCNAEANRWPWGGIQHYGRVYDTATSTPYYYYYPSLAVNSSGDMAIAFLGSKSTERIGAFFSGRRASGAVPSKPVLIQAGRDYFDASRYGD
jgi:hypothetical protein